MPTLMTADAITSAIVRIDAAAQGVAAAFQNCPKLDAGTRQAWTLWYAGWQKWETANSGLGYFSSGLDSIGNQTLAYETDVAGWQTDADQICGADIPILVPESSIQPETSTPTDWAGTIKWVAGAVIIGLITPPIIDAIKAVNPLRRRTE
jgi:hypothetical protein